jgi:hypothetical protein
MAWYLELWRNRSTASQALSCAQRKQKKGYGVIVAARRANAQAIRLIRRGAWVRRHRSRYRSWL